MLKKRRHKLLWLDPHCRYCWQEVSAETSTLDHVVPRCLGGTDDARNLVLACCDCNTLKAALPLAVFLRKYRKD